MKMQAAPPTVSVATMMASIASQARLIPAVLEHVTPQAQALVRGLDVKAITEVVATGCGDSLYAAMAARLFFEKYSGLRMEPIEALEFSRYTVANVARSALVIGISAGGDKSRTIEAIAEANRVGAPTAAIVGVPDSPLAKTAQRVIRHNESDLRPAPDPAGSGVFALGNYLASMVTLFAIGLELGIATGRIGRPKHDQIRGEIARAPGIIEATQEATGSAVREFVDLVKDAPAHYIVGGGPSQATALFGAAKLFEMPQLLGVPVELEEWAHEQYFLTRERTSFIAIAPPGASVDRVREQLWGARQMGAITAVICDPADTETRKAADASFGVVGELPEELCALTYCVPLEMFAAHLCEALGREAFAFISDTQFSVNMHQIGKSAIRVGS